MRSRRIPYSEFRPLFDRYAEAFRKTETEVMVFLGYADTTKVTGWKEIGVPAAVYLLLEARMMLGPDGWNKPEQFSFEELLRLFLLLTPHADTDKPLIKKVNKLIQEA